MRGGVFCLFFCCISALSAHYLFNKSCRGWRPRQPAFWTLHLVLYYTNFEKTHKLWQGRALFASFVIPLNFVTVQTLKLPETGRRGHRPLHFVRKFYCRKIAALFADFTMCRKLQKRCSFSSSIFTL